MEQFRVQAVLLCVIAVIGIPVLQGQVTQQVVYQVGVAEAVFCGTHSTDDTCIKDAESRAITSLLFDVFVWHGSTVTEDGPVWEPRQGEPFLHLVGLPIKVPTTPKSELQNVTSKHQDGPAWVSELTCNLVPIKIAKYSGNVSTPNRMIVGTYDALVSQACYILTTTHAAQTQGLWLPKNSGAQTRNMTQNLTFTARTGHQIVGVRVEVGTGDLTDIPRGLSIVEAPVPEDRSTTTTSTTISAAPPLSANLATVAIITALLFGSLVA
jgi:hypothetical protein